MNILFIASNKGILGYHLTSLAINLARFGVKLTVLSSSTEQVPGLFNKLAAQGIRFYINDSLDKLQLSDIIQCKMDILKIIKTEKIDIIHVQGASQNLPAFLSIDLFKTWNRPKIVTSIHFIPFQDVTRRIMDIALTFGSDTILPVSNYTMLQLGLSNRLNKVEVLHNAIDLQAFDSYVGKNTIRRTKKHKYNVMSVARLIPIKGQEYLLLAASKIFRRHDVMFYIVGDGPSKDYLVQLSRKLGLQENVVFTGRVLWPQTYDLLKNVADICVSPSLSENFPYFLLECMAARKPVVSTAVGGVSEAITDKVNGLLVPPRDPVSLANSIESLLNNPILSKELGLAGRKKVEDKFDMPILVRNLFKVYERVKSRGD